MQPMRMNTTSRQRQMHPSRATSTHPPKTGGVSPASAFDRVRCAPASFIHPGDIAVLQGAFGNRAVGALLQAKLKEQTVLQRQAAPCPTCPDKEEENLKVAVQRQTVEEEEEPIQAAVQLQTEEEKALQTKLTVGEPNDKFEQEADRNADAVVNRIQKQETVEPLQEEKPQQMSQEAVSRKPNRNTGTRQQVDGEIEDGVHSLRGKGSPLSADVRRKMETGFDADFSNIRVHNGVKPAQLNKNVHAKAFTVGNDIFFAGGAYSPHTRDGQKLLAHELTHTVQQGGAIRNKLQRSLGDDHDLRSPRFSGEIHLEMAFDNETLIRNGWRGRAVQLVQESLLEMGYALPQYGADGVFGNETRAAVIAFQTDTGAFKIDGIIGPETMGLLDEADTAVLGPVPGGPGSGGGGGGEEVMDGDSPEGLTLPATFISLNQIRWTAGLPVDEADIPLEAGPTASAAATSSGTVADETLMAQTLTPPPATVRPPWIRRVDVNLTAQNMTILWSNGVTRGPYDISSGRGCPNTTTAPCRNPNVRDSYCTPTGTYRDLRLGGENYRNQNGDSMCWYTAFHTARGIGIHDCQAVTGRPASHGCVRTLRDVARLIHNNVTSRSTVRVQGAAPAPTWTLPCNRVQQGYPGCPCP